jgi:hypothetical protein
VVVWFNVLAPSTTPCTKKKKKKKKKMRTKGTNRETEKTKASAALIP